jgi:hypothetical protein
MAADDKEMDFSSWDALGPSCYHPDGWLLTHLGATPAHATASKKAAVPCLWMVIAA